MFIVNPYIYASGYLLDTYSAAAAYSLRQLKTGVTNVVRVRRSSDSAESDFTATEITDGTLTTWTGANDGFVVKLYNQGTAGTNYDAVNTLAAEQPKLVSSGVVLTSTNGKPAMLLDGVNDSLTYTVTYTTATTASYFGVFDRSSSGITTSVWGVSFAPFYWNTADNIYSRLTASTLHEAGQTQTGSFLYSTISNGTDNDVDIRLNGSALTSKSYTISAFNITPGQDAIGKAYGINHNGYWQEFINIKADESANVLDIEANINGYYSIY